MLKCLLFLPSSWFRSWMVCLHEGSWGLLSHDCWNYSRKKQHRIRTQQKKHCSLLMLPSLPKVWKKNKKVESPKFIPPSRDVPGSYMWVKIQVSHGFFPSTTPRWNPVLLQNSSAQLVVNIAQGAWRWCYSDASSGTPWRQRRYASRQVGVFLTKDAMDSPYHPLHGTNGIFTDMNGCFLKVKIW